MFYSTEKPRCLNSPLAGGLYSGCAEYWDKYNRKLDSKDNQELSELLKAKNIDEQIKILCGSEVLRDYCMKSKVWQDKYPDLVDATTNIANGIRKEIFLRNNRCWEYLINHHLPLDDM